MNEKMVHPDWEFTICLSDGSSSLLVIENPIRLRGTVMDLIKQSNGEEGEFILSDDNKQLDIHSRLIVVTDPLNADPSNKRVTASVAQQIKEIIVSPDHLLEANDLISHMERFAETIEDDYRLNVSHQEYDSANLYKVLNIQLQVEYENELERLLEFMNVFHDVCGVDCFVFISIFSLFSEEEIGVLVSEATANKHNLLFIEGCEPSFVPEGTTKLIIDRDSCQIF